MYAYRTGLDYIDDMLEGLPAGTNVLVLAPSLSNSEIITYTLAQPHTGEWSIILSTDERAAEVLESFKRLNVPRSRLGVIDCITKSTVPTIEDTAKIKFVVSPVDLTSIVIKFSKLVEGMWKESVSSDPGAPLPPPLRFCINSLTTLLLYTRPEVVYRFLHVMTARVKKLEGIGIFHLNSESFDDRTISTIKQLMNIVIEVKRVDENGSIRHYFRIIGLDDTFARWYQYHVEGGRLEVQGI
ncbi:MAG: RAD55 family ATPase [Methanoculleaceae archaeon]